MRILHLSDVHFTKSHKNFHKYVLEPLLKDINEMHNEIPIELVLFTGDLIDKGGYPNEPLESFVYLASSKLSLAHEDPDYGMHRILKSDVAPDVEAYRVITTDDRKIFHPEYTDEVYLSRLTFDEVFNHPTVIGVCEDFQREELIDEKGRLKHYTFVHQAIHALVRALDNLGYKTDKNRAIKSSAHDIEHMIYASGTDILVTMDKKFKDRSKLIYQRLGISTNVLDWNEYMDYVDSLTISNSPEHNPL